MKVVIKRTYLRLPLLLGYGLVGLVKNQQCLKDLSYQRYFFYVSGRQQNQSIDYKVIGEFILQTQKNISLFASIQRRHL